MKKTKPITVFLPIDIRPTGGVSSFAKKFKYALEKRGHKVIFTYQPNYDVLLVSPVCPWRYLFSAKINNKPILHRLDGVYSPTTVAGWRYPLYNARFKIIQLFFADYTVYQSIYSIHSCKIFLGAHNANSSTLIYNAVDTDTFSLTGETKRLRDNPKQHTFITTGCFRRLDQVVPLINAFNKYRQKYFSNSRLVFIGNYVEKASHLPKKYQGDKNIIFMNIIDNNKLPAFLRSADVFLFSMQNSACPNNVIEAMACGLPVCGVADGSMPELTIPNITGELIPAHGEAFYHWRKIDTTAFARNMNTVMQNRNHYSQASHARAIKHYNLENMIDKYLFAIINLL